jgi:hypothetical protein
MCIVESIVKSPGFTRNCSVYWVFGLAVSEYGKTEPLGMPPLFKCNKHGNTPILIEGNTKKTITHAHKQGLSGNNRINHNMHAE